MVFDGYVPLTECQRSTDPTSSQFMIPPMLASYTSPLAYEPECMPLSGVRLVPGWTLPIVVESLWNAVWICSPAHDAPGMVICRSSSVHALTGYRWWRTDWNRPSGPLWS